MIIRLKAQLIIRGETIMTSKNGEKMKRRKSFFLSRKEEEYLAGVGNVLVNKMAFTNTKNADIAKLLQCTEAHVIALKQGNSTMNIVEALRVCGYFEMDINELLGKETGLLLKVTQNKDQINTQKLITKIKGLTILQRQVLVSMLSSSR